jgi:hypothetical protein
MQSGLWQYTPNGGIETLSDLNHATYIGKVHKFRHLCYENKAP